MENFLMWIGGIVISLGAALTGWVFKMVFDAIKDQREDHNVLVKSLSDHKLHAAENFATKTDVKELTDKVIEKLEKMEEKSDRFHDRIEEKIDRKADKKDVQH